MRANSFPAHKAGFYRSNRLWYSILGLHKSPGYEKGREALPGPLSVSTKYHCLQDFSEWAMLDLNQRPPPCKGGYLFTSLIATSGKPA